MKSFKQFKRIILAGLLVIGLTTLPGFQQGTAIAELSIGNFNLIQKQRVGRVIYEYTYTAEITNNGNNATNVTAAATSGSASTTVMQGELVFGDVPAGDTLTSQNTFIIRQDRRYPLEWSDLDWQIDFEPALVVGREVVFEGPTKIDPAVLDVLPKSDEGRPILIEIPGARLEIDLERRDPITVLGNCTSWIAACVSPGERSIDDCARSAPVCETNTPWNEEKICCPTSCFEQYRTERLSGSEPIDALDKVYFMDASCFPDVTGLLTLQQEE